MLTGAPYSFVMVNFVTTMFCIFVYYAIVHLLRSRKLI